MHLTAIPLALHSRNKCNDGVEEKDANKYTKYQPMKEKIMNTKIASIDEFIKQLKEWYESDYKGFKTLFDKAVENVQPIPEGQKSSLHSLSVKSSLSRLLSHSRGL